MIRITAKRDGFRRCGVVHSKAQVEHADGRFSAEELEILKDEPMLTVEVVDEKPSRPNAAESIKLVEAAADLTTLDALAAGEDRKSVVAAIEKKHQELTVTGADK